MQFQISRFETVVDSCGRQMSRLSRLEGERLSAATAPRLPMSVQRPGYDRTALKSGILHLGDGAFHRCHQAEWTDDALQVEFGEWGIVGVNLRAPDLTNVL